ncbi:MAG: VanZ family protein [Acidobacteria bacterium]|nr:VanZ family protein [Acidobacteriota bacterium]
MKRGIFSSPVKAWIAVALYTLLLYSTLTLAYDVYVAMLNRLGKVLFNLMTWMYLPIGLALFAFLVFFLPRRLASYLSFLFICLALAYSLEFLTVPAKRFHFFQYGPLTVLVFDALRFKCRDRYLYVWTLTTVALIGVGDETLQGLLPKRHFGLVDLVVNSVAGLLTLAFIGFVMREENYPWGRLTREKTRRDEIPRA